MRARCTSASWTARARSGPHQRPRQRLQLLPEARRALQAQPHGVLRMHVRWYWLADACQAAGLTFVLAHALYVKAIHGGKNKNDRIDSEKLTHLLRSNLIPPAYVYPAEKRPLRALLRQRVFYVWRRSELLARIHSHQLAHNRIPARQTRRTRDPWEEQLLAAEDHPLRQIALKNDLAMIRHFDQQIFALEEELERQTKKVACREYALLQTVPGVGQTLGLIILHEIGDIHRFPSVKDLIWSIRPSGNSTKNWIRTPVGNDPWCDSRLQNEWIVSGS